MFVACSGKPVNRQSDTIPSFILRQMVSWTVEKEDSVYLAKVFSDGNFCATIRAYDKREIKGFIKILESIK